MKDFAVYLSSLPRTPVTEAVTALYEGLTKSDMALGRYLKSFNKGVKVPPLPQGIKPNERVAYMMLARHPQEVAKLLDIGATYGIPEDGEEEFDDIAAEIDIQETIKKIAEVTSDRSRGAVRGATAEIVYVYEHLDRTDELKKAADLYRNGQSDAGYTALKDALGEINFEYVVYPIVKLWKSEDAYRDDKLFVLNPDIKSHLIRNRWLIHETSVDAGLSILKNGFDRGNLAGDLGMTTWGKHSKTGDYLFAHDVVDMLSHENYQSRGFGSYGNFALVFQGSGYKAYHDIDEENQVMFDYHEPKAFFVVLYRDEAEEAGFPVKNTEYEDYKYAVYGQGKSGAPSVLFANENVYKCLEWILQHGASYRNAMFKAPAPAVTEAVYLPNGQPERLESTRYILVCRDIWLSPNERMNQIYDNALAECDRLNKMHSDEFLAKIGKSASEVRSPMTREAALEYLNNIKQGASDCQILKSTPSMLAYVPRKNKYGDLPHYVKLCMIKPVQFTGLTSETDPEWSIDPNKRADNRYRRWKRAELGLPYAKDFKDMRGQKPNEYQFNRSERGNDFDNYVNFAVDAATSDSQMFQDRPNKIEQWADEKRKNGQPTDIKTYDNNLYESVDGSTAVFKSLEELRDYLDRAAYGTFENSEYDQYEQEPYGSLESIQEVSMEDVVKDMSGMNHDIQSLVGQPIDDKTLNQLVYDWFVCLHTRGAVGWQYNWN